MSDPHEELRKKTVEAISAAFADMTKGFGSDPIHGFALCTDDNLMSLFSSACTESWLVERQADDEAIGSLFTEWEQFSGDEHFRTVSEFLSELSENDESTVQQRYEALVSALEECRDAGIMDSSTRLFCGDTDGVSDMEIRAVYRLNSQLLASQIARDLGFSDFDYRSEHGATAAESAELSIVPGRRLKRLPSTEIIPGRGVDGCEIGSTSDSVQEAFGAPDSSDDDCFEYSELGVEVAFTRGVVDAIFFFFRTDKFKPFNGATRDGIGPSSSVADVKRAYGDPDDHDTTATSSGGIAESIYYNKPSVVFSFRDGELEDIRIFAAE